MTAIVVALPPRDIANTVANIVAETPLSRDEATAVLDRVVQDGLRAAHESGGPMSIWVGEAEPTVAAWKQPREHAVELVDATLPSEASRPVIDTESPTCFEAIAMAISQTGEASGAVLVPVTPFIQRRHLDEAAMRLRQTDVVLGPATRGTWYLLGYREAVTITLPEDNWLSNTIARQAIDSGYSMDLLRTLPGIWDGAGLTDAVTTLEVAEQADLSVGPFTRTWIARHSFQSVHTEAGPTLRHT